MDYSFFKEIAPVANLLEAERIAFIGPHPDDIEIGAGGLAKKLIDLGREVIFIVCTNGGCGALDLEADIDETAKIRLAESREAGKFLGAKKVYNLGYPDGGKYEVWNVAVDIAKICVDYLPDLIVAPDPSLASEVHPDHIKCAKAARASMMMSSNFYVAKRNGIEIDKEKFTSAPQKTIAYYFTSRPNTFIEISEEENNAKLASIKYHKSQFPFDEDGDSLEFGVIEMYNNARSKNFGSAIGKDMAEGYFALSPLQQHCFTEINNY